MNKETMSVGQDSGMTGSALQARGVVGRKRKEVGELSKWNRGCGQDNNPTGRELVLYYVDCAVQAETTTFTAKQRRRVAAAGRRGNAELNSARLKPCTQLTPERLPA